MDSVFPSTVEYPAKPELMVYLLLLMRCIVKERHMPEQALRKKLMNFVTGKSVASMQEAEAQLDYAKTVIATDLIK